MNRRSFLRAMLAGAAGVAAEQVLPAKSFFFAPVGGWHSDAIVKKRVWLSPSKVWMAQDEATGIITPLGNPLISWADLLVAGPEVLESILTSNISKRSPAFSPLRRTRMSHQGTRALLRGL